MTKKMTSKSVSEKKSSAKTEVKNNASFSAAVRMLVACCIGEAWLLVIRRYFINGQVDQFLAFADILKYTGIAGAVLLVVGVILALACRGSRGGRLAGIWLAIAGAFLAVTGWACYTYVPAGNQILCIAVPVVGALALVHYLYQREFFWSVAVLCLGILDLWVCRRGLGHGTTGTIVLGGTIALMVVLAAAAVVFHQAEKSGGKLGKLRLLPSGASYGVIYASCALSVVALAAALVRVSLAYYLIWALAIVLFALVVYYTVKQL